MKFFECIKDMLCQLSGLEKLLGVCQLLSIIIVTMIKEMIMVPFSIPEQLLTSNIGQYMIVLLD